MRRTTFFLLFLLDICCLKMAAQETMESIMSSYELVGCRYWFDNSVETTQTTFTNGKIALDVSYLEEGFHTIHYQILDSRGEVSPACTVPFFRLPQSDEQFKDYTIQSVRYWFDMDYTPRVTAYAGGTSTLDVSSLEEGFHTLHYQVIDSKGETSPVRTSSFFRLPSSKEQFKDYAVQTMRYWFENDTTNIQTVEYDGGVVTMDLSYLPEGAHDMYFQVVTDDGQVSPACSVSIDRWIYDIYISRFTEYDNTLVTSDPLFSSRPDLKLHFLTDDVGVRGHLTVDEGTTLSLGKFVQTANWGIKNDGNKYSKAGADYYHPTTLLNNGFMRADSVQVKLDFYRDRWHFLSMPFNVNFSDIKAPDGTCWVLRQYDGDARAAGEMTDTWCNVRNGEMMEAGRGYILQQTMEGTEKCSWMTFHAINDGKKNNIFTADDVAITMEEHQAEFAHNRSWNLVGNPYPCFFDTRCIDQEGTFIVWNGNGYTAYSLSDDNYILMPFEAFFIQKPVNVESLRFSKEGRQHTPEVIDRPTVRKKLGVAKSDNRQILNFTLSDGTNGDRSRIVINEQASMGYEIDKDAPKFMENNPQIPQLFSKESGVRYAINERPMDKGLVAFSVYAPVDGEYRFGVKGDAKNLVVLDTETNTVWALADGDYVFTSESGIHDARLIVSLEGDATVIPQVNVIADGEMQVFGNEMFFHFVKPMSIKVYGIDGSKFYGAMTSTANISLKSGVYVVDINGETTKILIK